MAQMKEQIKTLGKELNKMEISSLWDAEFKTLVPRLLKELSEDVSSIKKNPVRNDEYTNWNKEQYRVDEADNQINDLEHKEPKTTNQNNKKKKEYKNIRIV